MTQVPVAQPLFARPAFQAVAGEALRPGGLILTSRALDLCGLPARAAGAVVLDLGCGCGATARHLASRGFCVLALDSSPELLAQAASPAQPGIWPLLAQAQALPLADACLDGVFCECVLSVTGAARPVLAEAARALKPGGWLVLSDLYLRQGETSPTGGGDCPSGALPKARLLELLGQAGLAVRLFEDHSRLLAELAARLIFAGMPAGDLCGCGSAQASPQARPGYFLCLAQAGAH